MSVIFSIIHSLITGVASLSAKPLALNIAAGICYASGGVCMKLSQGLSRPLPSLMLFACFGLGAGLQAVALRRADLGSAYILVLGLEASLAFAAGILFFHEAVTLPKLLGCALIVAGILFLRA